MKNQVKFICGVCGGDSLSCVVKSQIKLNVIFEEDNELSLEESIENEYEHHCSDGKYGEQFDFFCSDCGYDYMSGTLDELMGQLECEMKEDENAEG